MLLVERLGERRYNYFSSALSPGCPYATGGYFEASHINAFTCLRPWKLDEALFPAPAEFTYGWDLTLDLVVTVEGHDYHKDAMDDAYNRHSAPPLKASPAMMIGPPSPSAPSDPIIRQAGPSLACSPKWARVMSDLQEQLSVVLAVPAASSVTGRAVVAGEAKKADAAGAFVASPSLRRSRHWSCLSLVAPPSEEGAAATLHCQCAGACCCVDAGAARYLVDQACGPDASALLLGDEPRAAKIPAREGCGPDVSALLLGDEPRETARVPAKEGCGSALADTAPEQLILH